MFSVSIVYDSLGRSRGMAIVNFQRSGDAAEARQKFNGKIIDGSKSCVVGMGVFQQLQTEEVWAQGDH